MSSDVLELLRALDALYADVQRDRFASVFAV